MLRYLEQYGLTLVGLRKEYNVDEREYLNAVHDPLPYGTYEGRGCCGGDSGTC